MILATFEYFDLFVNISLAEYNVDIFGNFCNVFSSI